MNERDENIPSIHNIINKNNNKTLHNKQYGGRIRWISTESNKTLSTNRKSSSALLILLL